MLLVISQCYKALNGMALVAVIDPWGVFNLSLSQSARVNDPSDFIPFKGPLEPSVMS